MEKKLARPQARRTITRMRSALKPIAGGDIAPEAQIDVNQRRAKIAELAYYRAQQRGFLPGYEVDDWLAAEIEFDTQAQLLDRAKSIEVH